MIFVTVGAQMAFPRLVNAVDNWARRAGRKDVFAQIGPAQAPPLFIKWEEFLSPKRFTEMITAADVVVGHAGMGTIIGALCAHKPLIVMPRRGDLKETRNDHQVATAHRFATDRNVAIAMDEHELLVILDRTDEIRAPEAICGSAPDEFLNAIRSFIRHGAMPAIVNGIASDMHHAQESGPMRFLPSESLAGNLDS